MLNAQRLRLRILSTLGVSALAGMLPNCGGSVEVIPGEEQATGGTSGVGGSVARGGGTGRGGSVGSGGTLATGGTVGTGGSVERGGSGGSVDRGGSGGSGGTGGTSVITTGGTGNCSFRTMNCLTPEEAWRGSGGSEGGADGDDAADMGGRPAAAGHGGATFVSCPVLTVLPPPYGYAPVIAGPHPDPNQCCYTVEYLGCVGRPFTVENTARVATVASRHDWSDLLGAEQRDVSLQPELRERIGEEWLADALLEHASVASFARLTMHLMQLGAPPELVFDSQRASLDEIAHARLCFALASRYLGTNIGPGTLNTKNALGDITFSDLAVLAVEEGCIGETLAALLAAEQARGARDPFVRATLERICEDEARHAELAWRIVSWAIEQGGELVRADVMRTFQESLTQRLGCLNVGGETASDELRAHGRLASADAASVIMEGIHEVIMPCARKLVTQGAGASAVEHFVSV